MRRLPSPVVACGWFGLREGAYRWHAGLVASPLIPIKIETDRLVLRRPSAEDATVRRQLWTERDPRVPPHRRIGPDGRPTVEDIAASLRPEQQDPKTGLLTIMRTYESDAIGYCGLIFDGRGPQDEPEMAYELLRRAQGFGYATEAARGVLEWAAKAGYRRVWAGVRRWNGASLRVLQKLAFVDTGQDELDADYGDTVVTTRTSRTESGKRTATEKIGPQADPPVRRR